MPSLADPAHKERSDPDRAIADLIWFPTGGGKTEVYLGVAAFTMAIRRYQNDLVTTTVAGVSLSLCATPTPTNTATVPKSNSINLCDGDDPERTT